MKRRFVDSVVDRVVDSVVDSVVVPVARTIPGSNVFCCCCEDFVVWKPMFYGGGNDSEH